MILIAKYFVFAVIAIACNLVVQRAVFFVDLGGHTFLLALSTGTCVGLVVKYWLDARWIFILQREHRTDVRRFVRYGFTGVITTLIFWGSETVAWVMSQDHTIRELAAIAGLAIGYLLKYQLDSRFVFANSRIERCES